MPKSGSFLSVNAGNLIVSAVKHSEKGEDLIIRVVETSGEPVSATVKPADWQISHGQEISDHMK